MKISIPDRCSQSWSEMRPLSQGRHCGQCDKQILDFRKSSDLDLKKAFYQGKLQCGLFSPEQLNRSLASPSSPIGSIQALVLSSTLGLSLHLMGQEKPSLNYQQYAEPVSGWNMEQAEFAPAEVYKGLELKGRVLCEKSGETIPFANVYIPELKIGCSTDFDGNYCLAVQEGDYSKNYRIKISFVGYETLVLEDVPLSILHENTFKLKEDLEVCGQVVVLGYVAVEDLKWTDRVAAVWWRNYYRLGSWFKGD